MNKIYLHLLGIMIIASVSVSSCSSASSSPDKFFGEWKRVDKAGSEKMIIKKEDDAILIAMGKQKCAAVYKKKEDVLKIYFLTDTSVIRLNEKSGDLLINNGADGEFKKID